MSRRDQNRERQPGPVKTPLSIRQRLKTRHDTRLASTSTIFRRHALGQFRNINRNG
ncbi:hypothetical protein PSCLAVI8L_280021 [Pseudoclavibacter sp. 8L]|nr:hypothetical protein PSCLAVI8L_280021 [Pseudoclavibacter sp. 8L]